MVGVFTVPSQITRNSKVGYGQIWTGHQRRNSGRISEIADFYCSVYLFRFEAQSVHRTNSEILWRIFDMSVRNEIKAQIVRAGMTMQEVVDLLHDEYGWSDSVSNLSAKLQRESIRYKEVLELADVLGYDIVWQKGREK